MQPDPQAIRRFLTEARNCAMQMMDNARYIQKELPFAVLPGTGVEVSTATS